MKKSTFLNYPQSFFTATLDYAIEVSVFFTLLVIWELSQTFCVYFKNKNMDFFKKKIHTFNSDLVFLLLRLTGKKSVTFLFWETLLSDLKKTKKSHDFSTCNESWNEA